MQETEHEYLQTALVAKKTSGELLSEEERLHVADCVQCMQAIVEALERKHKTEGPAPDSDPSRPSVQRALERARQIFQREFGISLAEEPPAAKAS
jgi:hypothetical protein